MAGKCSTPAAVVQVVGQGIFGLFELLRLRAEARDEVAAEKEAEEESEDQEGG